MAPCVVKACFPKEIVMLRSVAAALVLSFVCVTVSAQEQDVKGSKDHALLSRMAGYYISSYETKEFDSVDVAYLSGPEARWEGRLTRIAYTVQTGGRQVSMVQIGKNYEAAVLKAGGKVLYTEGRIVCARIEKGGAKTYVQASAFNDGANYELIIVETGAMVQEVVADAAVLKQGLAAEGKVAVYGIFFDSGKAIVKAESEPTLVQVVKLLTQNPGLKVFVVGHTDGTGTLDANVKLSADRAAAVVAALAGRGIAAARLKPYGVGPYSPVATNRTEDGRLKNRRVELVEQF
jgi:outer membrane protein OmpA-like peptidoglycan-associated protein